MDYRPILKSQTNKIIRIKPNNTDSNELIFQYYKIL